MLSGIVTALLAACMIYAAVRKLSHSEDVVRSYARAGVPEERLNLLAALLLAGAAGLLAGLAWEPFGTVAAAATAVYFAVAVAAHVRAGDAARLGMPLILALLAVAVLVL